MKFNKDEEEALIDFIKEHNKKDYSIVRAEEELVDVELIHDKKAMQGVRLTIEFLNENELKDAWKFKVLLED